MYANPVHSDVINKMPLLLRTVCDLLYLLFVFPQRQLSDMKQSSQLRIQLREKEAQELRQAIFSLTVSAN